MIDINPRTIQAYRLFHNGILALQRAEQHGIRIDVDYIHDQKSKLTKKIGLLENKFKATKFYKHWNHTKPNPNIYSGPQLGHFLYKTKKLTPAKTTPAGQGATDEEALKALGIKELNTLLKIRKLKKVRDTYLQGLLDEQVNGIVHPVFNLHFVRTFRSSSNSPNFQNFPKRDEEEKTTVRKAIYPRKEHCLMEVDYKALEVRIAACYHNDPNMIEYIENSSTDMHGDMSQELFMLNHTEPSNNGFKTMRQAAKNGFVFPQFYGDYYKNCAENLCDWVKLPKRKWKQGEGIEYCGAYISNHLIKQGIKSFDHFMDHVKKVEDEFWNKRFYVYKKWKDSWWELYQKYGYVDMKTGFRCGGLMSRNDSINYPIQGAAFHCLLWSFIQIDKHLQENNMQTRLIGQIHDAIVLDVFPDEKEEIKRVLKRIMCKDIRKEWDWITVPLEVEIDMYDVDKSWADKI